MNPDSENEIQTEELCKPSVKSRLDILKVLVDYVHIVNYFVNIFNNERINSNNSIMITVQCIPFLPILPT